MGEQIWVLWTKINDKQLELEKSLGIFVCSDCGAELGKDHPLYKKENAKRRLRTNWLCGKCGHYEMEYGL